MTLHEDELKPDHYRSKGAAIVQDRAALYGSPVPNMQRFARIIEAVIGAECTALQATMIMVGIKILRESHGGHLEDNLDDIEGYVEIARQIVKEEQMQGEVPGAFSADSARS